MDEGDTSSDGAAPHSGSATTAPPSPSPESPSTPSVGRHRGAAFEIFILGELMDGPHHGYLLRDILTRMLGPHRRVSWAAIYPLIRHLERAGVIALEPAGRPADGTGPSGHRRRVVRITASGRERFYHLMRARDDATADYHETFTIKLLYLRFLAPEEQWDQLERGQAYLDAQVRHLRHVFTAASTTAPLPPDQRAAIFRMIRFRLAAAEAELQWVVDERAALAHSIPRKERSDD
jgi:DNA-binding PadR family transcriptional regulator